MESGPLETQSGREAIKIGADSANTAEASMSRKSPSRIRKDLEAARNRVNVLIGVLRQNESERRWGLGAECLKAIESLQKLLHENQTPHEYKVAVIGRFKAGKSSFVNVLLDRRLHTPAGNQPVRLSLLI